AALALKALGFIVYHPTLVASLSEENAYAVLQSLVEIITTTKMKAICNLAVWCISIQQFESCFIVSHIQPIIRATVHALDNPMGSISTTVEAFQAVVKLLTQASNMMKDLSHIWSPPIYRRLVSTDKRERDMAERCLQKIRSTILPPLPLLSKTVSTDIKQNLLLHMEKMLESHGCKVYVLQAWGWFIRLLGDHVVKIRTLVNQMLKIPEQTFADPDSQVRIASQVAWEALVDALILWPIKSTADLTPTGKTLSPSTVEMTVSEASHQPQVLPPLKNLKLLMKPIVGVMTSKCDVSVRLSCWKTWNYILHKLDNSVNNPAILSIVLDPILKVVFETGPDNKNLWIWDLCMNLLEEFVSLKVKDQDYELNIYVNGEAFSPRTPCHKISSKINKDSFPALNIKWIPWNINQTEFLLINVGILWKCGIGSRELPDFSSLSLNGALRIFRLILRGVQSELHEDFKPLNERVQVVHLILKFVQGLCQDIHSNTSMRAKVPNNIVFSLLEVIKDELPTSTLTSFSFKMPIDLEEIWKVKGNILSDALDSCTKGKILGIYVTKIEMVSPAVYLILVWLNFVVHICSNASEEDKLVEKLGKLTQIVASGVSPLENFQVLSAVLYTLGLNVVNFNGNIQTDRYDERKDLESLPFNNDGFFWLRVWKIFAKCLKEHLEFVNDVDVMVDAGYKMVYSFLLFPINTRILYSFANLSDRPSQYTSYKKHCNVSPEKELYLVLQVWTSLYNCVSLISSLKSARINFLGEGFCKRALRVIEEKHNEYTSKQPPDDCESKQLSFAGYNYLLLVAGGIAAHVLKQARVTAPEMLKVHRQERFDTFVEPVIRNSSPRGNEAHDHNVKGILTFVGRFLELAGKVNDKYADCNYVMVSGVYGEGSPVFKLEKAWVQLLNCLQKCQPPIIFDSNFLSLQAPLLVAAFQHIHSPIANHTVAFWEATYGNAHLLTYPTSLVPVLRNLLQKVKINLPGFSVSMKGQLPLASCSTECANGDILEQSNNFSNYLKTIDIHRPHQDFENSNTPDHQSAVNKLTSIRANNSNAKVASIHIRGSEQRECSHLAEKILSRSLQGVSSSQKGGSVQMTQKASLSQGRKKLEFMDESPKDYVSIPSTVKRKQCPLTDHQREVKRAQRGCGIDTMGHGPGIKTYTAADFSQGNGDSEEPEEFNLADIILNKCKKVRTRVGAANNPPPDGEETTTQKLDEILVALLETRDRLDVLEKQVIENEHEEDDANDKNQPPPRNNANAENMGVGNENATNNNAANANNNAVNAPNPPEKKRQD
ncbi:hypothetical protein KI387_001797, partial [Taxus chinensis]